jgi:hypothetical protein
MSDEWIWIVGWERFQHYNPPWIKNYLELLGDEDYLSLTSGRRALLHGLWLSFASSRLRLKFDVTSLNSRLRLTAKMSDYEALIHAGFVEIVASATLTSRARARGADARSQDEDRDGEVEPEPLPREVSGSSIRSYETATPRPAVNGRTAHDPTEDIPLEPRTTPRFDCPHCAQIFPTWSERNTHLTLDHKGVTT